MNRETIDRIKKTVQQLAPELEVLKGEKGDKGDSISWKGAHRKDAQYLRFDVVTYDDAAWLATERTKSAPPYAPWVMLCRSIKGERGDRGEQGVQGLIGKQGPEGPQGARGEPGMVWTGAYQNGRRYSVGDVVSLDGSAYVAVGDTQQSPDGGAGWQVLVRRGDTGTPGPRGPKGEGFEASEIITLTNTTASSSSTTGALITAGGIGAAKDCFVNSIRVGKGNGSVSTNTAFGRTTLNATTGGFNTAIGFDVLEVNSSGTDNTGVGYQSLTTNDTGLQNTAVGSGSLQANLSGNNNTAVGLNCMFVNVTGGNNAALGHGALRSSTGSNNTAIGAQAGYASSADANTSGANNTFVGYQSVGAAATDSNVVTLGNPSIGQLRCAVTTITAISDARDKTDIEPLAFGLDFINALNPVSFTWNMRQPEPKDGEPVEVFGKVGIPEIGFIAQELQAAQQATGVTIPGLVSTSNPDRLEAAPSTILPVLVKAIQQLSAQVTALQAQVAALEG
jgi:hypothetical protein